MSGQPDRIETTKEPRCTDQGPGLDYFLPAGGQFASRQPLGVQPKPAGRRTLIVRAPADVHKETPHENDALL